MRNHLARLTLLLALLLSAVGCKSTYYSAWEKLGYHKRDILTERVTEARDGQAAAQKQFTSALDQFKSVVNVDGGALEAKYTKLKGELDRSEAAAAAVRKRIASVDTVANDLFKEWTAELAQYNDPKLRAASEQQLGKTREQFAQLMGAMKKAEGKMEPVLVAFRDQVLFLKHNLNAKAVAGLKGTAASLETDVSGLVREMQKSIDEANEFLANMKD